MEQRRILKYGKGAVESCGVLSYNVLSGFSAVESRGVKV